MIGRTLISSLPSRSGTALGRSYIAKSNQLAPALSSRIILDALHRNTYNLTVHSSTYQRWHSSERVITKETSQSVPKSVPSKSEQAIFRPTSERKYEFFQNVEITSDGVAIVRFDNPAKKVNTISFALQNEFEIFWNTEIHSNESVKAVVFASGKPNGFIAGADIFDIQSKENKEDIIPFIESATNFFHRLKSKGLPLVCAINGPALGGGLEWALWCDYRICSDSPKTKLGLPEVKLGLLPGLGGTQNLHKLVGLQKAMDMMLTGKDIRPDRAKKMGLVDLVVAPQSLERVAIDIAKGLADKKIKKSVGKSSNKSLMDKVVEGTPFGRNMMWKKIDEMVQKNTNGNYPAPFAIIDSVKYGLEHPEGDAKYKFERESFAKLAATKESEALIGIFDGMARMRSHEFGKLAHPINKVAVMGAGLMGAGIAQVTAEKGYEVLLKDRDMASVGRGESYISGNWAKKVKRKRMSKFQYNSNSSNLVPLTDDMESWKKHFAGADMVVEAVFEEINLKRKVIAQCEDVTPDHCIFATNTSAIPIADIAEGAKRPEQIIGMHYFSPVPQMPLLEIIPHGSTSDSTKAAAFEVGTKQGKTCIEVKDVPGFYVNRCLGPFLVEVSALVRDGVELETLDKAIRNFGMPVGPVTLADEVGIDVTSHVANFLSKADLGARMQGGDISLMENMIEKGWLGKKSGQGFYTYKGKEKTINSEVQAYVKAFVKEDLHLKEKEIQDRIMSRFVNEAAKCLEDEIISDPVVGDIGLVFGTGFAPFRGGPFRYLDSVGVDKYVGMMNGFAEKYGPQFEPCQLLKDYAAEGKKFHS
eukprot:CAMPEP_0198250736 /NCGR_PEP_ID=MMETSP1447-20131203/1798_1 /TAXON_ID=420782 /ORGANISM="Chaetoceros dichaeta, Strain CCMP1751" /LENGTH=813 /DNA_ID=CAMNT_0043935601 /DNA_START=68 /DNA_END=2509 /DNA_ORIENTATION=-